MSSRRSEIMRNDIQMEFCTTMRKLQDLWDEIGFTDKQINDRGEKVILHVRELFKEMVSEETILKNHLTKSISKSEAIIADLCVKLSLPTYAADPSFALRQKDKVLKDRLKELDLVKNERMSEKASLQEKESSLCQQLYSTPYYIPKDAIPSAKQLQEIRDHITSLKNEKLDRLEKLASQKMEIVELYEKLGASPECSFSQDLMVEDSEMYVNTDSMDKVRKLLDELNFRKSESEIRAETLWSQIEELWKRLEVDEDTRDYTKAEYHGIKAADISGLEKTLFDLQQLKLANLQKLTESIRSDLTVLWDKCFYSLEQRQRFYAAYDETYTEELLMLHELELENVKKYYNQHKVMFNSVKTWQNLFNRMLELEEKARNPDPNRYNNRGGKLLKEERERKTIHLQLPKNEEQLFNSIEKWETDMNEPFLIEGTRFTEYVHSQWEAYEQKKELDKQKRAQKKQEEIKMEMTFGSTPKTPTKRAAGMGLPPKTPTTGKKKRLGGMTSTINCTTSGRSAQPLTPSNRTNMFSSRCSPGRTPISFRVQPGSTIKLGCSDKKKAVGSAMKSSKQQQHQMKAKKTLKLMPPSQHEQQQASTTAASSPPTSIQTAPPATNPHLDSTFSVTVISDEASRRTVPLNTSCYHHGEVHYDDFAREITQSGSKVMRSSAIGDRRFT